jgi:hypothetical protein
MLLRWKDRDYCLTRPKNAKSLGIVGFNLGWPELWQLLRVGNQMKWFNDAGIAQIATCKGAKVMANNSRPEERHAAQAAQESIQASQKAARKGAEEMNRLGQVTANVNSQVVKTAAEILGRHMQTAQHVLRSGAEMTAKLAERSSNQFGLALGITGDNEDKAAQTYSDHLHAILDSSAVLTEMGQRITLELVNFGQTCFDQELKRFNHLLAARTPQDLVAAQTELMRSNLEGLLELARRTAKESMRTTEDLARKVETGAQQSRKAA